MRLRPAEADGHRYHSVFVSFGLSVYSHLCRCKKHQSKGVELPVSVRAVKSFLGLLVCHYSSHDASQVRTDIAAHN